MGVERGKFCLLVREYGLAQELRHCLEASTGPSASSLGVTQMLEVSRAVNMHALYSHLLHERIFF